MGVSREHPEGCIWPRGASKLTEAFDPHKRKQETQTEQDKHTEAACGAPGLLGLLHQDRGLVID